ncbi:hypothetical protein WA026_008706 [Henosepilachna vigintioctopunctata]|uniref:Uncharacterized protein n=1 Tax=Henosepilachna vigintioctopunctata TaxID=420089 RepID=A0AAW1V908_9CUCU
MIKYPPPRTEKRHCPLIAGVPALSRPLITDYSIPTTHNALTKDRELIPSPFNPMPRLRSALFVPGPEFLQHFEGMPPYQRHTVQSVLHNSLFLSTFLLA